MSDDNKNNYYDVEGNIIEGHEYDGIQELDNPLPKWWLFTFYITIVFSIFYYGYYEVFDGPSHKEQLEASLAEIEKKQASATADEPEVEITEELIEKIKNDSKLMALAKSEYEGKCTACHLSNGAGLVGPNLTDKYWIHSKGEVEAILLAIKKGYPDKGMPPWEELIPKEAHIPLAVYVTLFEPAEGKEPQGELVP
jgi:cytochrome c oxidase cbb3-type subunit 3